MIQFNDYVVHQPLLPTNQEEVGNVVKPRELLKAIRYEISSVQKIISESKEALEDGHLTHAEAQAAIKHAEIDMKRLSYEVCMSCLP